LVHHEKEGEMACQVLLEFRIREGCHDKLKQKFVELLPATRAFDGCISIYMVQDQADPAKIVIVEAWDTKAHYDKYLQWRVDRGDMDALATMLENPTWRFLDFWGV
jgi:quinol monooxygenase YgiN